MNREGGGIKRLWANLNEYPEICLEGVRKPRETSVRVADIQTEIRSKHLPNTSL
jgi:hypothetical protein